MSNSNTPHGARGSQQRATSSEFCGILQHCMYSHKVDSGNTSNYGTVSTTNATNGGSAGGRSNCTKVPPPYVSKYTDQVADGQQPYQGMPGGAPPGYYVNGGYQPPASMNGHPPNVPLPHNDPNPWRLAGYGPSLGQEGELGDLDTLVTARGPVIVPTQQQQYNPPTSAGGYAPGAGSQYPQQNPTVNGQPAVNGTHTQSGNTHRYPTQAPRQPHSGQSRRGDDYRRQQGPSSYGRRSGY